MKNSNLRFWIIFVGSCASLVLFGYADYHYQLGILKGFPFLIIPAALPGLFLSYKWTKSQSEEANTLIYTLYQKGKVVYIGITYTKRVGARIDEHRRSGKVFDRIDLGKPYPREEALNLEARLIRKENPKYNIMHAA